MATPRKKLRARVVEHRRDEEQLRLIAIDHAVQLATSEAFGSDRRAPSVIVNCADTLLKFIKGDTQTGEQ
jgi:hypothetical protein